MSKPSETFDFNAGLKELEAITEWFESEDVDLDAALPKFERGMTLAAQLRDHLKLVENKVEKIKQRFDIPAAVQPVAPPPEEGEPGLF